MFAKFKFNSQGLKEINLISLDPVLVEKAKVVQRTGPVTIDSTSSNSFITGYSKGRIERIGGFDRNLMEIRFKAPHLNFNGTYKAKSHVLGIPVNGGGPYKVTFGKKKRVFVELWVKLIYFQKNLMPRCFLISLELREMEKNILKLLMLG